MPAEQPTLNTNTSNEVAQRQPLVMRPPMKKQGPWMTKLPRAPRSRMRWEILTMIMLPLQLAVRAIPTAGAASLRQLQADVATHAWFEWPFD